MSVGQTFSRVRSVLAVVLYIPSVVGWIVLGFVWLDASVHGRWDSTEDSTLAHLVDWCAKPGVVSAYDGKLAITVKQRGPDVAIDPPVPASDFGPKLFEDIPATEVWTSLKFFEFERSYGVDWVRGGPVDRYWVSAALMVRVPMLLLFAVSSLAVFSWPAKGAMRYVRRSRRLRKGL